MFSVAIQHIYFICNSLRVFIVLGGKEGITNKIRKGVTIQNIMGENCIFINRLCPRL